MSAGTGGPAFPLLAEQTKDGWAHEGMTLRDLFAAKAMQGVLANHGGFRSSTYVIARHAYAMADAMLAAREVVA